MKTYGYLLSLIIVVAFSLTANAHTQCKLNLGFGNWTEGCPHFHTPPPSESTLPGGPGYSKYTVEIHSAFPGKIEFDLGRMKNQSVSRGQYRAYEYEVGGYNSSRLLVPPTIRFDRYANDGKYTSYAIQLRKEVRRYEFWLDGNTIKFSPK
jgi:hypothetical protein